VNQAQSGYRPKVNANANVGYRNQTYQTAGGDVSSSGVPGGVNIEVDQTLFDGFRTENRIRQADASVLAQRELLRTTEQDVLLLAVTAYMDVVRDMAILDVRQNFVDLLGTQLKATSDRFNAGELTRTDVAQAEARQALSRSQMEAARARLNASRANFRRFIGADPKKLQGNENVEKILPKKLDEALVIGSAEHPQVRAATYGVDSADFAIAIAEGALLPSVSLNGIVDRSYTLQSGLGGIGGVNTLTRIDSAAITGRVTVPIYQGGLEASQVRQSKEIASQRRIEIESVRDQIRALVVANWGNLDAAKAQLVAVNAQSSASQIALNGVREEAKVGQRTVLDALNAEQELLDARVNGIVAQRDRVVAGFALLGAIGRLNATELNLKVESHDPTLHYTQVRDRWHGLRTPGGQ
ncbi:MAG: TolC family outer membrane protein, partial [Pseudomonadota bacterium]